MSARLVALAVAAALVLPGCSLVRRDQAEARPLTVVLFDVSRSTQDPAIRARYAEAFQEVVQDTIDRHGTVVGDVIDDNPLAHSSYPIDATFDACNPLTDNQLVCEARTKQQTEQVATAAEQILGGAPGPSGTDIRAGVQLAERVFAAYPDASDRSLVLLSDMVEHVPAREDATPNLAGVRVYVVGAGVVAHRALPARTILSTQRFWLGFFTAAGADLAEERYGAALIRFP